MTAALRTWILFSLLCVALGSLAAFAPEAVRGRDALCDDLTVGSWVQLEYCHPGGLGAARDAAP